MYITVSKVLYPESKEIEISREDVVDKNDNKEHQYNFRVNGMLLMSLTKDELITIVDKGEFALKD